MTRSRSPGFRIEVRLTTGDFGITAEVAGIVGICSTDAFATVAAIVSFQAPFSRSMKWASFLGLLHIGQSGRARRGVALNFGFRLSLGFTGRLPVRRTALISVLTFAECKFGTRLLLAIGSQERRPGRLGALCRRGGNNLLRL